MPGGSLTQPLAARQRARARIVLNSPREGSALGRLADFLAGVAGLDGSLWRPLLRGAVAVFGVTALAQLLALVLQVLLARLLGPVEFGIYGFVIAGLGLCLILVKLGLDTTLIRFVAQFAADEDSGRMRGLVRVARTTGLALGVIVGSVVVAWVVQAGDARLPEVRLAMVVGAVVLPLAAFSELTAAALRGLRRVPTALAGDGLARPLVAGAVIVVLAAVRPGWLTSASALVAYLLGTVVSLWVTSILLGRILPPGPAVATATDVRRYLRTAVSLMLASGFLVAMYSLDTVMLGLLADTTAAGFYSVASRVAIVVLFVMNAAQMVSAPMLAASLVSGAPGQLRGVVRALNGLSLVAAVPAVLILLVAAEPVMEIFGPEFRGAAPALRLLALSQLLNVLTGPTGMVLSMTGQESILVRLLFGGLLINVVLNLAWIPEYGILGAAGSALIAQCAWNLAAVVVVRARLSLDITPLDLLRRHTVRVS